MAASRLAVSKDNQANSASWLQQSRSSLSAVSFPFFHTKTKKKKRATLSRENSSILIQQRAILSHS